MQRVLPSLRGAVRSYSTAPAAAASSNLAPILLGAGLLGAGGFYYSTLGSAKKNDLAKAVKKLAVDAPAALSKDEFRNFKLEQIIPYNHNSSTFVFTLPEGTQSGLSVASCLVVKSATEGKALAKNGKAAIRPYTPVTAPDVEGKIELLVKKYVGGAMTEHIFGLKVGDELSFKGPNLKFPYKANEFESIALIAGGAGITPMWQIMQEIDVNPSDKTKVTLIFGNVSEADILLRKEFEDLAARKPDQFKVHFVLDKPPTSWSGASGFINQAVLAKALPGPAFGDKIKIFVCGPPPQVESISGGKKSFADQGPLKGVLADLGYTESQVFKF